MEIGVIFPQTEIEPDPAAIKDFAQAAEELGYSYIFIADHVLGADPKHHEFSNNKYFPALQTYNHKSVIHESLTLMGYLSSITRTVGLVSGILILPQRQTVLVAKQAAEVDVLSGGRLRLGIGVGWNSVEYQALGEDFHTRGARMSEQITVLRELWTKEEVNFHGRWHTINHAGLNPLPIQRPIPIWLGAGSPEAPTPSDKILKRIARLADGWCPNFEPDTKGKAIIERVNDFAKEYRRDQGSIGIDGRLRTGNGGPEKWMDEAVAWKKLGTRYLSVENRWRGLKTASEHILEMERFKDTVGFDV